MNSGPLLKPLPAALGVLWRERIPVAVKLGLGCPVGASKGERDNFNSDRQKMSLAGMSLGLELKVDSHFCHEEDHVGLHLEWGFYTAQGIQSHCQGQHRAKTREVPQPNPVLSLLCPVPAWVRTLFILDLPTVLPLFLQP